MYEELYAFMKWCLLRSCNFNTLGVTWLAKGSSFLINHSSEYVSASSETVALEQIFPFYFRKLSRMIIIRVESNNVEVDASTVSIPRIRCGFSVYTFPALLILHLQKIAFCYV